jgi:hypothetical protein
MMNFLFWNLNKKPIAQLIATLAFEQSIDVLILAECSIGISTLLTALNANEAANYSLAFSPSKRLLVFSRLPRNAIKPVLDDEFLSVRRILPPVGIDILLVAAHLSSKLFQESSDQALTTTRFPRIIEDQESAIGHRRTVVVGDLNMNPFEHGVIGGEAFHAVMDKRTALKVSRVISGQERLFFYNPMWGRLGDSSPGPPGTYYRQSSKQVNYFWNAFDQVLLRPELIRRFDEERFKVVTTIGATSLLTEQGIPDLVVSSDHLPLVFGLDLSEIS